MTPRQNEPLRRHEDSDDFTERREQPRIELSEWASFVAKVGIPGVIALWMVYTFTTAFTVKIDAMTNAIAARVDAHAEETRRDNVRMLLVLRQICVNTAATPEARGSCFTQ